MEELKRIFEDLFEEINEYNYEQRLNDMVIMTFIGIILLILTVFFM